MISRFLPKPVRRFLGVPTATSLPGYRLIDRPEGMVSFLEALDRVASIMERRTWARTMTAEDYDELKKAVAEAGSALRAAYP